MKSIRSEIDNLSGQILNDTIDIRRYLHQNPELSYKEFNTSAYIRQRIENLGIDGIVEVAKTGLLGHIKGGLGAGKKVVLRAELDALPIVEKEGKEYRSRNNGVMHACGHDAHMAMLLSSIEILYKLRDRLKGDIYFLFQPGEELAPGGASIVLDEGVLQNINPDAIIAQHVLPELESGKTGFRVGKYMASSDEIYIDVKGRGGHAALPGTSTDQVLIASKLVNNLKRGVSLIAKDNPVTFAIGRFIAEGATNIIPDNVHMEGTLRTFDESLRDEIHSYLQETCKAAEEKDISLNLEIRKGYPVLINNESLCSLAINTVSETNGSESIKMLDLRMSSEDFAYYSHHFPSIYYRLGVLGKNREINNLHTAEFDIDEKAMSVGIKTLCNITVDILNTA